MRYIIILFLLFTLPAQALIKQKTSYNYFRISGNSAVEIYQSLMAHAKGPSGHDAFATTKADIRQRGNYIQGKICRTNATMSLAIFKIQLPQLTPSRANATVLSGWREFSALLKRHEEHHRALWLACTENFNSMAARLEAKSCSKLKSKYLSLWNSMLKNCKAQNQSFDQSERAGLASHPFIQLVAHRK
jgi:predicted secreted Zn-dependent protease